MTLPERIRKYLKNKEWVSTRHISQLAQKHGYDYDMIQRVIRKLEHDLDVGTWYLSEDKRTNTGVMLRGAYIRLYPMSKTELAERKRVLDEFEAA